VLNPLISLGIGKQKATKLMSILMEEFSIAVEKCNNLYFSEFSAYVQHMALKELDSPYYYDRI
jgi:hypothetical protein